MSSRTWSVSELLSGLRDRAERSGRRVIDLGQGAPVDPTPELVTAELAAAADWPGYPPAQGIEEVRTTYCRWAARRWGTHLSETDVVTTVGSKEFIATLPWLMGLSQSDLVAIPELAYPTYAAGAHLAGCRVVAAPPDVAALDTIRPRLLWLNTPGNPTGEILTAAQLTEIVAWARERGITVVSDECYIELTPPGPPATSILSPEVNGGRFDNLVAVHSLSKRSNMAGYRIGFASGDPKFLAQLQRSRRDAGLIAAGPVQRAAVKALADDNHVFRLQQQYAERRAILRTGLTAVGWQVKHSEAGLFIWATVGESDAKTSARLADLGILVAPGGFYGSTGDQHVRLSLTASLTDLAEVGARLLTAEQ